MLPWLAPTDKTITMRKNLMTITLVFLSITMTGQNCFCISGTKNKKTGIETVGGVTNTRNYFSLLVQKIMDGNDKTKTYEYRFLYHVPSDFLLTDSMLNTYGTIELMLIDKTPIIIDSVEYQNNPLGFGPTVGFWFYVSEETINTLSSNPIEYISVINILAPSSFTRKRQKEQMRIYSCLLKREPR